MPIIDLTTTSEDAALATIGERLARYRLNANMTQAQLAREAGVSRKTVSQLENGASVHIRSLIRVLRALGLSTTIDLVVPEVHISPIQLVDRDGQLRQRARPVAKGKSESESVGWVWRE